MVRFWAWASHAGATGMGAKRTLSHIPFDFGHEPSIGPRQGGAELSAAARSARSTGLWVVEAARCRPNQETTHDQLCEHRPGNYLLEAFTIEAFD